MASNKEVMEFNKEERVGVMSLGVILEIVLNTALLQHF